MSSPMRGVLFNGKVQLSDNIEVRDPRPNEVTVKIAAAGLCHSDLSVVNGTIPFPPPVVLGHEAAGVIASGPNRGARVAVNPLVPCGICDWCLEGRPHLCPSRQLLSVPPRPGAFAEFIAAAGNQPGHRSGSAGGGQQSADQAGQRKRFCQALARVRRTQNELSGSGFRGAVWFVQQGQ